MNAPFRPQHLDEMVGQEAIRQKARIACQAALLRGEPLPHVLLTSSGGGLGKTSFAGILANEMYTQMVTTTGQCLRTVADLRNLLVLLDPGTILLVDEAHCIGKAAAEELLLVLEDGILNMTLGGSRAPIQIEVPKFTLCAASTQPECLSLALHQRFGLTFRFDFYADSEIRIIVEGIFRRWSMEIEQSAAMDLARRARGVPRIALRLAERVRDVAQAQSADAVTTATVSLSMEIEDVDSIGLTRQELDMLAVLADAEPRPVSARSLSLALGVGVATVTEVLEPSLVRFGLMTIGSGGRRLTARGISHLNSTASERSCR